VARPARPRAAPGRPRRSSPRRPSRRRAPAPAPPRAAAAPAARARRAAAPAEAAADRPPASPASWAASSGSPGRSRHDGRGPARTAWGPPSVVLSLAGGGILAGRQDGAGVVRRCRGWSAAVGRQFLRRLREVLRGVDGPPVGALRDREAGQAALPRQVRERGALVV